MFSRTEDLPEDCEPTTTCEDVSGVYQDEGRVNGVAYDLRKVQGVVADGVEDEILQLIHHLQQLLTKRRHRCCRSLEIYSVRRLWCCNGRVGLSPGGTPNNSAGAWLGAQRV